MGGGRYCLEDGLSSGLAFVAEDFPVGPTIPFGSGGTSGSSQAARTKPDTSLSPGEGFVIEHRRSPGALLEAT